MEEGQLKNTHHLQPFPLYQSRQTHISLILIGLDAPFLCDAKR
jgi:hypothetical protein